MRRTKSEIFLHFVWRTWRNEPLLTSNIERAVYRCIQQQAEKLECDVVAVNGMPDHVHLVIKMPPKLSPAEIAKQVKGISSTFARNQLMRGEPFGWQDRYAVFSITPSHIQRVVHYVNNQKAHHSDGSLIAILEETDEETPYTN
jgi:putative transposase